MYYTPHEAIDRQNQPPATERSEMVGNIIIGDVSSATAAIIPPQHHCNISTMYTTLQHHSAPLRSLAISRDDELNWQKLAMHGCAAGAPKACTAALQHCSTTHNTAICKPTGHLEGACLKIQCLRLEAPLPTILGKYKLQLYQTIGPYQPCSVDHGRIYMYAQ